MSETANCTYKASYTTLYFEHESESLHLLSEYAFEYLERTEDAL